MDQIDDHLLYSRGGLHPSLKHKHSNNIPFCRQNVTTLFSTFSRLKSIYFNPFYFPYICLSLLDYYCNYRYHFRCFFLVIDGITA
jgi:hypothetical protein